MRRLVCLIALAAAACQNLRGPDIAPVLVWSDVSLIETNGPGPTVKYEINWPVSGGRPALLAALQAQVLTWLRLEDAPGASEGPRAPAELLRRRQQAMARTQQEDAATGTSALPYTEQLKIEPLYDGRGVISMRLDHYLFTGGAHGVPASDYAVFDRATGRRIDLDDLITPAARGPITELIKAALRAQKQLAPDAPLSEAGFWEKNIQPGQDFYLDGRGLWFCYEVYEIAPYSSGRFAVCLPYAAVQAWAQPGGPLDAGWAWEGAK